MPAPDEALPDGDLAFREHIGGHTDTLDWPVFLKFAATYFNRSVARLPRNSRAVPRVS